MRSKFFLYDKFSSSSFDVNSATGSVAESDAPTTYYTNYDTTACNRDFLSQCFPNRKLVLRVKE